MYKAVCRMLSAEKKKRNVSYIEPLLQIRNVRQTNDEFKFKFYFVSVTLNLCQQAIISLQGMAEL